MIQILDVLFILIEFGGGNNHNPSVLRFKLVVPTFLANDLDFLNYLITADDVGHVNEVKGVVPVGNLV